MHLKQVRVVSFCADGSGSEGQPVAGVISLSPFLLVCVLKAVECVVSWQVSGGCRVVWIHPPWSSQATVETRALTDSGHYHLLSAPLASGQNHLTLPVVTKCCRTAGCKVKYSLL